VAIYHLSIKITSRGKGKSAVAAAAYRAGEKIKNEYDGMVHDYTRKRGIVHSEILLPDNAPTEYKDRAVLWNAVEKVEKFKTAQLAREIEIALPKELTLLQNKSLVREYVKKNFVDKGMCADIAIHDTSEGNPHAHILLTMRPFNEDKTWGSKQKKEYIHDPQGNKIYDPVKKQYKCKSIPSTDWNDQSRAEEWRAAWAETANKYLAHLNHAERIDHRSFERQDITDQIPTIHLGVAASQLEKRGIRTERGDINREIEATNQKLRNLKMQIVELKNDISSLLTLEKETQANHQTQPQEVPTPPIETPKPETVPPLQSTTQSTQTTPPEPLTGYAAILAKHQAKKDGTHPTTPPPQPTQPPPAEINILDMLKNMLSDPQAKAKVQRITSLSVVKSAVEFLEQYNITTLSKLQKTFANTESKFDEVNEKSKAVEERLKILNPLIKQADFYLQHREINKLYKQQKPKHKDRFYEANRAELTLYEAAERFLKANLDGTTLNTKAWKKEAAELTAEKDKLYQDYSGLKEGVRQISIVQRSVEHILDNAEKMEQPQQQRRRSVER